MNTCVWHKNKFKKNTDRNYLITWQPDLWHHLHTRRFFCRQWEPTIQTNDSACNHCCVKLSTHCGIQFINLVKSMPTVVLHCPPPLLLRPPRYAISMLLMRNSFFFSLWRQFGCIKEEASRLLTSGRAFQSLGISPQQILSDQPRLD